MREKAKPTVQIDDDKVKVTRWDFSPGAETGWHRHEMDYIVCLLYTSPSPRDVEESRMPSSA